MKEKATLSQNRHQFGRVVIIIGSFLHPANSIETISLTDYKDIDEKAWLKAYEYILSNWSAGEEQVALNQLLVKHLPCTASWVR